MSSLTYRTSRPDKWVNPRPYRDPSLRLRRNGPIQPMETGEIGILARLFGLR